MPALNEKIIDLRRLLAARMPSTRLGLARAQAQLGLSTGIPALDALLGGGWPVGETAEVVGEGAGSGSAQLLHALLAHSATEGRFAALVDGADSLDVDAMEPAVLARLLWARCRTVDEALKATDILLRDSNIPLVILDLKLNPMVQLRRISSSIWHRFGRLCDHHKTTLLVVTSQALVGGVSVRVRCRWNPGIQATSALTQAALDSLQFEVLRQSSVTQGEPLFLTG